MPSDTLYHDVFISYSRKDKVFARRLFDRLKREQLEGWADWEGITGGEDWERKIYAAIDSANTFIFIISPDSLISEMCNREILHARQSNKRIIPIQRRVPDVKVLAGEWYGKPWETIARENYTELGNRQFILFRRKPGDECEYDETTHEIANPECDSPDTDADDFETAFQTLLRDVRKDPVYLRDHTRLLIRAREWDAARRDVGRLLSGSDLRDAEIWLVASEGKSPPPTDLHRTYVNASFEQQARAISTRRRNLQILALVAAGFVVILTLITISAVGWQNHALEETNRANQNATLSADNAGTAISNFQLAQTNAVAAQNFAGTSAANALSAEIQAANAQNAQSTADRRADEAQSLLWTNYASQSRTLGTPFLPLPLALAANSIENPPPAARRTLAELAYTPGPRFVLDIENEIASNIAISPNGKTGVVTDRNGDVILWNAETGEIISTLQSNVTLPLKTIFSPDGSRVLVIFESQSLLWDLETKRIIARFEEPATTAALSPDGRSIVFGRCGDSETHMGCFYGELIIWDVERSRPRLTLQGHPGQVRDVAFSPNGDAILSGSESSGGVDWLDDPTITLHQSDSTLILWDAKTGQHLNEFGGYTPSVTGVEFSPSGEFALSVDEGGVKLWPLAPFAEAGYMNGLAIPYDNFREAPISFTPDGLSLVLASGGSIIQWNIQANRPTLTLELAADRVTSVAISPDAHTVFASYESSRIIAWDAQQGDELEDFPRSAGAARLSPDGRFALSVLSNNSLELWDIRKNSSRQVFQGGELDGSHVVLSPDGSYVASGSDHLVLWDVQSGKALRVFPGIGKPILTLVFSPDGSLIVSGHENGTVAVWDVDKGELQRVFGPDDIGYSAWVITLSFQPDGKTVNIGMDDSSIFFLDIQNGASRSLCDEFLQLCYLTGIRDLTFSPDGHYALTEGSLLADLQAGEMIKEYEWAGATPLRSVFSPDGSLIATGYEDGQLIVRHRATGDMVYTRTEHTSPIFAVAFSADGLLLASASQDGTVLVWDAETGEKRQTFENNSPGEFIGIAFSLDSNIIIYGTESNTPAILNIKTGSAASITQTYRLAGAVVAFSPDGQYVLSGAGDLILWNIATGHPQQTFQARPSSAWAVVFSPDGNEVLAGLANGTLMLWSIETGGLIQTLHEHKAAVKSVVFIDEKNALSASDDGVVIYWDLSNAEIIHRFEGQRGKIADIALSPDNKSMVAAYQDGTLIIWDLETGENLRLLQGHSGGVTTVAFSPNGGLILSGSCGRPNGFSGCTQGELILWDVVTGEPLFTFRGHGNAVRDVVFMPDGQSAISVALDGTLIHWRVDNVESLTAWTQTNRYVPTLTCDQRQTFNVPPLCEGSASVVITVVPFPTSTLTN